MGGESPRRFVLLGPPASGKGTQGRKLAAALDLAYLSTGALLREQVEGETSLGKKAKPILDRGEYLPDELMFPLIGEWLDGQSGGWVLDGFPRSIPQAEFLRARLETCGSHLEAAIALDVPFSVLLHRIKDRRECPVCRWSGQVADLGAAGQCPQCGAMARPRADDGEENFRSRFREFTTLTQPAIAWYEASGQLVHCDATALPEIVAGRLLDSLSARFVS